MQQPLLAEHELQASGRLRLLLVLNLSRFLAPLPGPTGAQASRVLFNELRGSEPFLSALRNWRPQAPFEHDREQERIEEEGYRLRVFRTRLRQSQFLPTYRMHWTSALCEQLAAQNPALLQEWRGWDVLLRFSPYGLAMVMLERRLEHVPLLGWTEQLLEMRRDQQQLLGESGVPERQGQWWLSRYVLTHFLADVGWQLPVQRDGERLQIGFQMPQEEQRPLRLDHYTMYCWERLAGPQGEVSPQALQTIYRRTLAGLLEASLVVEPQGRRYPGQPPQAPMLDNLASWDEELCLLGGEAALIYTPLVRQGLALIGGAHGETGGAYADYWAAIVRGVEHVVLFRAEAERAQRRTVELLAKVPRLTRRVNDGQLNQEDEQEIAALAAGLSEIFHTLPEQRSMEISAIFFRADYARRKFAALMQQLDTPQILAQVDTNVEQLSFFLDYYNGMRLQWRGQRIDALAWRLALIVLVMAVASFLADAFQVLEAWHRPVGPLPGGAWALSALGLLLTGMILLWRHERRRH